MAPPKKWSPQEIESIFQLYCVRKWTAKQVAQKLGLTVSTVSARLRRANLRNGKHRHVDIDSWVRRCHAKGMNDNETARKITVALDREIFGRSVKRSRERQGLPSNYDPVKHRIRIAAAIRDSDKIGSQVRYDNQKLESVRLGWPPVTERARRLLQCIEEVGCITSLELAALFGYRIRRPTKYMWVHRYLCRLRQEGWLQSNSPGGREVRWKLSDSVKDLRERWRVESRITNEE